MYDTFKFILKRYICFLGNESPSRVHDLFAQNEDLMQSLQQANNQVSNIKQNLQEREVCTLIFSVENYLF